MLTKVCKVLTDVVVSSQWFKRVLFCFPLYDACLGLRVLDTQDSIYNIAEVP